jgi:hypothetical protein
LRASQRVASVGATPECVQWVEADLSVWEPGRQFDLVTTHYAHAAMPQLAFYERIAGWVAPGGTLLVVGHLHSSHTPGDAHRHEQEDRGHQPPDAVSVTAASITAGLDATRWDIVTAAGPDAPDLRLRSEITDTPDGQWTLPPPHQQHTAAA